MGAPSVPCELAKQERAEDSSKDEDGGGAGNDLLEWARKGRAPIDEKQHSGDESTEEKRRAISPIVYFEEEKYAVVLVDEPRSKQEEACPNGNA
jgi:hypothetical protein